MRGNAEDAGKTPGEALTTPIAEGTFGLRVKAANAAILRAHIESCGLLGRSLRK